MRIAIMGIRGIPANYGGFETLAEELAPRLVKKGHQVTVYGRSNIIKYKGEHYKGVRLKILPTISHKYLDTIVHTFLCVFHSLFKKCDVILICNAANSIFSSIPRLTGKKVVVNVDGIERKRKKWNKLSKLWYLFGEFFSIVFPNKILEKFGVEPNKYFLYVSRLEPENNAHIVIKAFEKVKTDKKLVIVGDAPYAREYINSLKKTKDSRIIFTGFVFGQGYKEFQSHAYGCIHATEVGGTHPALIEAMGFGNCIIANGTPENIEVIADVGIIYKKNNIEDLRKKIEHVIRSPEVIRMYGEKVRERF